MVPEGSVARRVVSARRLMLTNPGEVALCQGLDRPRLPTPVQVGAELWKTTRAKLTAGSNGALDPADYERTVESLLAGSSNPVISREPEGPWTHAIRDKALD